MLQNNICFQLGLITQKARQRLTELGLVLWCVKHNTSSDAFNPNRPSEIPMRQWLYLCIVFYVCANKHAMGPFVYVSVSECENWLVNWTQIFPLVSTYARLCVFTLTPPSMLVCGKLLGGPLICSFNRPHNICMSYGNESLTLNKCVTDSQQDLLALIDRGWVIFFICFIRTFTVDACFFYWSTK